MPVYVDDMYLYPMGRYRNMKMSHMIADTRAELFAMAKQIEVSRGWLQGKGTPQEHFDICMAKREAAVAAGAKEVTMRELAKIRRDRRATFFEDYFSGRFS